MSNQFTEEWLTQRNREVLGVTPSYTKESGWTAEGIAEQERRSEAEIEAECTKLLEEDGWRALRTDPVSDRTRGKGFGEVGMADHLYMRYAKTIKSIEGIASLTYCGEASVLWIEFKRPGEKAKSHQQTWHTKERARGALTLIAGQDFPATVQGFSEWYAASGLKRH